MKKAITFLILILVTSSLLLGCTGTKMKSTKEEGKLTVYTTVYPLQYFTERIGGGLVSVKTIYPPGADEHTFEPSQRDMMNIADANVFFYIGLGLEGFVEKSKKTLENEGVQFIPVGEELDLKNAPIKIEEEDQHGENKQDDHDHLDVDPHVWLDPVYAAQIALVIKNTLVAELPEKEKTIDKNYEQLVKELNELDSTFQNTIEHAQHKEVIVSHAAYGYWEKRYGLKQISISGWSSASEPTQKDLEEIVKVAQAKNLKYILFEQNISSKLGKIIQHEIGAKPLKIHNLATLTEDNLKNNETYFTLMKQNIDSLSIALNN